MSLPADLHARGKVRDIYEVDDRHLLMVTSDRISAFDVVLPAPIPDKGRVLTGLSLFWFERTADIVPNHLVTADVDRFPPDLREPRDELAGRSMLVRRAEMIPIECVARGFLSGSGWKEYREAGTVCGVPLPEGLQESARLPEPIFTPATKAETGHDQNITLERAGEIVLCDEVMTPDSSRFWPADAYRPGGPQPSFDKQYVRDWLDDVGWDHEPPAPELPPGIVAQTSQRYAEAYDRITGEPLGPWSSRSPTGCCRTR